MPGEHNIHNGVVISWVNKRYLQFTSGAQRLAALRESGPKFHTPLAKREEQVLATAMPNQPITAITIYTELNRRREWPDGRNIKRQSKSHVLLEQRVREV